MNRDIHELLPFYVNGSLDADEKARVEKALQADPALQAEIDFLERLRDEVRAVKSENPPGELGLKRLQKAIAEEKLKTDPIARARKKIAREQNWGWRAAAIAACLLLMLQTVATLPMWTERDLGAAGGKTVIQAEGQIIAVTFVPDAREENIRALLLAVDASIIDGPSALGVYKLAISKNADAAVEKLRAHRNLIETAYIEGRKAGP